MPREYRHIDCQQVLNLYRLGLSGRQIANILGVSKSGVYRVLKGISRSRSAAAQLRRPAKSQHWRSSRAAARNKWERANGPIPPGHHIHHRNGDYTDNRLANLECISASDHVRKHHPKNETPRHLRPKRRAYMRAYLRDYWERKKGTKHAP